MRWLWIYIASNILVGWSLALPLFLLVRQRQIEPDTETNLASIASQ